jgi:hypothetical protein
MTNPLTKIDFSKLYNRFDAPLVELDCGALCAPHNSNGKPFCCDICEAVPAVYRQEWEHLQRKTDLWHVWRGDECAANPEPPTHLQAETPDSMLLLACLGPQRCQRQYRALSCRQFPFFPYIASDGRFVGLAYYWEFEKTCWVISNLGQVTESYRKEFIQVFTELFSCWPEELESYAGLSEELRRHYSAQKRRVTILHRNGGYYLLSPISERLQGVEAGRLPRFGDYNESV